MTMQESSGLDKRTNHGDFEMNADPWSLILRLEARAASKDLKPLTAFLDMRQTDKIADLGAGFGWITKKVADGCELMLAVEPDPKKARRMHGRYLELNCIRSVGEAVPCRDAFLDKVYMRRSFHHLKDQHRVVKELYRILKPMGSLVIQEVNPRQLRFGSWVERKLLGVHMNFLPSDSLKRILEDEGFSISRLEFKKTGYFVKAEKSV